MLAAGRPSSIGCSCVFEPGHPAHAGAADYAGVRHLHGRRARRHHLRRRRALRAGGGLAFLAVVGPGLLAGLSDDDPAGITTYSILGAEHGYQLLWVLLVSTVALILFHDLG